MDLDVWSWGGSLLSIKIHVMGGGYDILHSDY